MKKNYVKKTRPKVTDRWFDPRAWDYYDEKGRFHPMSLNGVGLKRDRWEWHNTYSIWNKIWTVVPLILFFFIPVGIFLTFLVWLAVTFVEVGLWPVLIVLGPVIIALAAILWRMAVPGRYDEV